LVSPFVNSRTLSLGFDDGARFCNQRGIPEQHVKEGWQTINRVRLPGKGKAQNDLRLQIHAPLHNLSVFLQGTDLPKESAGRRQAQKSRSTPPPHAYNQQILPSALIKTYKGSQGRRNFCLGNVGQDLYLNLAEIMRRIPPGRRKKAETL